MDTQLNTRRAYGKWLSATSVALAITIGLGACTDSTAPASPVAAAPPGTLSFDRQNGESEDGRIFLIADQFNNRVIEADEHGTILWHFGGGPDNVGPTSIIGVNDAQRVGDLTLMAGTGAPAGTEPACPTGCADNRVMLVNRDGDIVWQYGTFGVTGAGPNELSAPVQSTYLPNGHVLITDQGNQRIIEVERGHHEIVWQYGTTGVAGAGPNQLNNPNSAELLENGHILISDESNNRAIEVNRAKHIVATYSAEGTVSGVAFASRLDNGHTLITDSNNNRIVEVNAKDEVVWQYITNTQTGSNPAPLPTRAVRLEGGTTLISDQFNHRVIEVTRAGAIVKTLGRLNSPGFNTISTQRGLNGPYDAKVIGDFTGLTPPR
jgi:flagellar biosynthesis/type III secretory pathway chaperone